MQNNLKILKQPKNNTEATPPNHHSINPYNPIPTGTKPESSHRTEPNKTPNLTHI